MKTNRESFMHKKILMICLLNLCIALFLSSPVWAKAYPNFYRGVRPLGMGNAFTAVGDDENALFYNPAALAQISTLTVELLNPTFEASNSSYDLYKDSDDIDTNNTGQVAELLRKYVGEPQHARISLFPHAGFKVGKYGVMVGYFGQATLDAEIRDNAWPQAETTYIADHGPLVGLGRRIGASNMRIGATVKYLHRENLDEIYTATDIADDNFEDRFESDLVKGTDLALDIGVLYTLPYDWPVRTDVGLSIQNLPKMDFGNARDQKTQANIGIAIQKHFAKCCLVGALDYRDLTHALEEDDDIAKRLHMGLELQLPKILAVRAGLNQGYATYGVTLDFRFVRLDFASYTEEVGAYAGQRDDRRYVGQLTFGW